MVAKTLKIELKLFLTLKLSLLASFEKVSETSAKQDPVYSSVYKKLLDEKVLSNNLLAPLITLVAYSHSATLPENSLASAALYLFLKASSANVSLIYFSKSAFLFLLASKMPFLTSISCSKSFCFCSAAAISASKTLISSSHLS